MPRLYLASCDNDRAKATERWRATQQWRRDRNVDSIAISRQPKYHDIKRVYPHYLHGKTRDGAIFMWERVGRLDTSAFKSGSDTTDRRFALYICARAHG